MSIFHQSHRQNRWPLNPVPSVRAPVPPIFRIWRVLKRRNLIRFVSFTETDNCAPVFHWKKPLLIFKQKFNSKEKQTISDFGAEIFLSRPVRAEKGPKWENHATLMAGRQRGAALRALPHCRRRLIRHKSRSCSAKKKREAQRLGKDFKEKQRDSSSVLSSLSFCARGLGPICRLWIFLLICFNRQIEFTRPFSPVTPSNRLMTTLIFF